MKTGVPGEKLLGAKETTNDKLNSHMAQMSGFEPWATLEGDMAVTAVPPLLPRETYSYIETVLKHTPSL